MIPKEAEIIYNALSLLTIAETKGLQQYASKAADYIEFVKREELTENSKQIYDMIKRAVKKRGYLSWTE